MSKLLPCLYCKDSWLFASKYDYGSDYENLGYQGTCKCGKFDKKVTWNKTREQAIAQWNYIIANEAIETIEMIKERYILVEKSPNFDARLRGKE